MADKEKTAGSSLKSNLKGARRSKQGGIQGRNRLAAVLPT